MTAPVPAMDVVQSADVDRTARTIKGDEAVRTPTLERRQGVVTAVDVANAKIDVTLGGNSVVIPGVSHLSNYRPTVGDTVWVDVNGPDLLAIDRIGAFGPSVIATAASAFVDSRQTRSSGTWGDLSTVGPSVTVSVSPSGRLLVQNSCWLWYDDVDGGSSRGGGMSFALSGANTRSPEDREAVVLFAAASFVQRETIAGSKVTLLSGLNPGSTTITAKYRHVSAGDGTADFELRHLWALPL